MIDSEVQILKQQMAVLLAWREEMIRKDENAKGKIKNGQQLLQEALRKFKRGREARVTAEDGLSMRVGPAQSFARAMTLADQTIVTVRDDRDPVLNSDDDKPVVWIPVTIQMTDSRPTNIAPHNVIKFILLGGDERTYQGWVCAKYLEVVR